MRLWGEEQEIVGGGLRALSSIADDVWHDDREVGAYEWWYFDAVSADARDVLVIIFLSGFLFSPRYNRAVASHLRDKRGADSGPRAAEFPAVAVCLYRDGKPFIRSIVEYDAGEFTASPDRPSGRIGRNRFDYSQEAGGHRLYQLTLDQVLRGGRRLQGEFSWQVEAGDFSSLGKTLVSGPAHEWNLVAPRCQVVGQYRVQNSNGQSSEYDFRGTGYHDHNRDRRWIPRTVAEWLWGRAHFSETTAVFYRYRERDQAEFTTRLYLAQKDALSIHEATYKTARWRRNHFGLRYPQEITVAAIDQSVSLIFDQEQALDSSFFYLRFFGEATLAALNDNNSIRPLERAPLVSERLVPGPLGWRPLWWLIRMRIGKGERASFLP